MISDFRLVQTKFFVVHVTNVMKLSSKMFLGKNKCETKVIIVIKSGHGLPTLINLMLLEVFD